MNVKLSDHFTYKKLLRFTIPSILMMIFTSIYGVVDGFWISIVAAELMATLTTLLFLIIKRKKYGYFG